MIEKVTDRLDRMESQSRSKEIEAKSETKKETDVSIEERLKKLEETQAKRARQSIQCFHCGKKGHTEERCYRKMREEGKMGADQNQSKSPINQLHYVPTYAPAPSFEQVVPGTHSLSEQQQQHSNPLNQPVLQ